MPKPYWCFICQTQFTADFKQAGECPSCHEQAFEEITPENHPDKYEVYQNISTPQNRPNVMPPANIQIRIGSFNQPPGQFNQIFSGLFSNFPTIMNQSMRMLDSLMANLQSSGQRYRKATPAQIDALQKIDKPSECSICQNEQIEGHNESYRLRCGHEFHIACITPWFEKADTCPTCRTKLTPSQN